jgi:hypothetical protein
MRWILLPIFLLSHGLLMAQMNDWAQVKSLAPGTRIVIATHHRLPCLVNNVSDEGIECVLHGRSVWIDRARIDQVHLATTGKGVLIATAAGAAAGGTLAGFSTGTGGDEKGLRVLAGGALGGFVGFLFGHIVDHANGPLIYRKP